MQNTNMQLNQLQPLLNQLMLLQLNRLTLLLLLQNLSQLNNQLHDMKKPRYAWLFAYCMGSMSNSPAFMSGTRI